MHSNKYKRAWYWFRNLWNFDNFEKQNDLVWMVKPRAACKVLNEIFAVKSSSVSNVSWRCCRASWFQLSYWEWLTKVVCTMTFVQRHCAMLLYFREIRTCSPWKRWRTRLWHMILWYYYCVIFIVYKTYCMILRYR